MNTDRLSLSQKRKVAKLVRENDKGLTYHRFSFEPGPGSAVDVRAYASNARGPACTQWVWVGYADDLLEKYAGQ